MVECRTTRKPIVRIQMFLQPFRGRLTRYLEGIVTPVSIAKFYTKKRGLHVRLTRVTPPFRVLTRPEEYYGL